MTHGEAVEKLKELITDIDFAMMSTADTDGSIRSRPMSTQNQKDHPFDGKLWFFTRADAPKVEEIEREWHVNVSYADPKKNRYVSVSGRARLVRDRARAKEFWNPIYKAWFPQGLEDPQLALLCVDVDKAEYWDFASSKMVQLAGFVKAVVTGKQYEASENENRKIDFQNPAN